VLYQSPVLLLLLIAASIFLSEVFVMLFMAKLPLLSPGADSLLDALILTVLLFPILYFSLFRPLVHHIAERKRAEGALLEHEAFLETIIESEPECVKLLAPDGKIMMMNKAGLEMLQADSLAQVQNHPVSSRVVPEYRAAFDSLTRDVFQGRSGNLEFPIVGLKGRRLWLETYAVPLRGTNGEITALLGITRNITERRKAEEELRASEERFQRLADTAPVMIWMSGTDKLCTYFNRQWLDFTGRTLEQELGDGWLQGVHGEDLTRCLTTYTMAFDQRAQFTMEYRLRRRDGEYRWVYDTGIPLFSQDGQFLGYIGSCIDISDRKLAEKALQESEDKYRTLATLSPVGIFRSDEEGRCVYVNERWKEIAGISDEQAMGEGWSGAIHPDDRKRVSGEWYRCVEEKRPFNLEYRFLRPDGIMTWVVGQSLAERSDSGQVLGYVGTITDISQRKRSEEQLLNVARGVSASTGERFFHSLVEHVARALEVDWAFIGEIVREVPHRIRSIAMYRDGGIVDNVEYDLPGTPCENVVTKTFCAYPSGVQHLFPLDPMLGAMGIEGYAGMPLLDSAGETLGIIAVLHRQPLRDSAQLESMIRIFATRAAAELERSNAEKELGEKSLELTMNLEAQSAINALLQVSLEDTTLDEILGQALDKILSMSWLPSDSKGAIFLAADEPDRLELKAVRGFDERMKNRCGRISYGQCLCGRAASSQEILFAESVDDRHEVRYEGMEPHGQYCVPIVSAGKTLGVINLHLEEGHIRCGKDEDFLRAIAGALGGIVQRKHMKEEKEQLIGELKDLVATVSRSQREWLETFDSITDVIFLSDRDFNIIRVNRAIEKMLGIPMIQILGRKCHELFHGTTFAPEFCLGCETFEKGRIASVEMFEPHVDKFIEVRVIPRFDRNDTLIGLIHVIRDITEQKELEDQLRHAQKMEAVGQLAGGVAHDFNNILTGIISCGNLLQMKLDAETPLRRYVDYILDASQRGASLVRGLLAFSRKEMLYSSPVDLNGIVAGLEPLIQKTVMEDIGVRTVLADEVLTVMADKTQIEQVLINLVANARDAMSAGGEVTIRTERLNVGIDSAQAHGSLSPGMYAVMSVSDTGEGMDEKIRERVFEPFFTTKEVGKGTGLGLSIVYGIVKQHEGYIGIESQPGKGTTVKVYLPLIPGELEPAEEEESVLPQGGSETLLFAEDDPAVRGIVKNLLEEFGYTVIDAIDGEDAVKKFAAHQDAIRLVVLDVIMPRMNGKEAYETIKGIRSDVKTVFMSGYASDVLQSKFILEDGLHFLQKPVSPATLLRKIREVLDA
jgi:PAS domain S-box-containing protein